MTCGHDYFTFNLHQSIKAIKFAESLVIKRDVTNLRVGDDDTTILKIGVYEGLRGCGWHQIGSWE